MASRRIRVLVALADRRRAEELAAYLGEAEDISATLADEPTASGGSFDACVSDGSRAIPALPTVRLGDGAASIEPGQASLRISSDEALIAAAIRLVTAGYAVGTMADSMRPAAAVSNGMPMHRPVGALTHREQQVVALLAEGASNKLIARRLDISVHTAKFHVAAILEKLGAVNRTDAIAIAMREGLVLV